MIRFNTKTILLITSVCLIAFGILYYQGRVQDLKEEITAKNKLTLALTDDIEVYKNKNGELVNEKLTLQVDIRDLNKINDNLNSNQKNLLGRINKLKEDKDIISAALIKMQFQVDSIQSTATVEIKDSSILFTKDDKHLDYSIRVNNVSVFNKKLDPILYFDSVRVYNKQFVEFHWGDKKEGFPVSFSVTNSNPYFVTTDVDSYIIPEIKKLEVTPTFWKKSWNVVKETKNKVVWTAIGAGAMFLILK